MADENAKQVLVYTYDTTDRLHPFTGAISVAEGTALTDGQTDVAPTDNNQFWNGTKWVGGDQLVTAYHYDANGYWDSSVLIPEGAPLLAQETTVVPYDANGAGMHKPKFDTTQNVWVETLTQEEIDALNKPATPEPDAQDQLNKQLMVRIAGLQTNVATQSKLNANLIKELTEIKKKLATDTTTTTTQEG
ncbi:MAG: hypothetical protein ACIRZ4_03690 [Limosilactobacillus mucosae]